MSWERHTAKLSSIFEISETDCSKPVMMPIFSNSSHEMPNPSSVGIPDLPFGDIEARNSSEGDSQENIKGSEHCCQATLLEQRSEYM